MEWAFEERERRKDPAMQLLDNFFTVGHVVRIWPYEDATTGKTYTLIISRVGEAYIRYAFLWEEGAVHLMDKAVYAVTPYEIVVNFNPENTNIGYWANH